MEMQVGRSYEIELYIANNMKLKAREDFRTTLGKSE